MACAREHWAQATLLCITHDLQETLHFDRVLVIEQGRIVEDGIPQALATQSDSRYRALLKAEDTLRDIYWNAEAWRTLRLEEGHLTETSCSEHHVA